MVFIVLSLTAMTIVMITTDDDINVDDCCRWNDDDDHDRGVQMCKRYVQRWSKIKQIFDDKYFVSNIKFLVRLLFFYFSLQSVGCNHTEK